MAVYLLSDLELGVRDAVVREPDGPHAAVARGADLQLLLAHLDRRPDCRTVALLGVPDAVPDLDALSGRRLYVAERRTRPRRQFVELATEAGADVEWFQGEMPPVELLSAWLLPIPAIVLAAGSGSRMGGGKMLRPLGGRPLVCWAIDAAIRGGCHGVFAVYAEAAVREAVAGLAQPVFNPEAASGQASSLRAGLLALPEEAAAAVILLGDQPLVGGGSVREVLATWRTPDAPAAVAASYAEGWLPPVVIDRGLWPDVEQLTGDQGARALFRRRPELLRAIPVDGRAEDADTPADLARIEAMLRRLPPGATE
ncbi:MAG: nucleotidyltransferase family protein [Candidatus Dormiibacterota bacterium]